MNIKRLDLSKVMPEWKKDCWIAKRNKEKVVDRTTGQIVQNIDAPILYKLNYQPVSGWLENSQWGSNALYIQKAICHDLAIFNNKLVEEGDLAYLDGVTPDGEVKHGDNSNYTVIAVKRQQEVCVIYFRLTSSIGY